MMTNPLYAQASKIIEGGRQSITFGLGAVVISPLGQFEMLRVIKMQIAENYISDFGSKITVDFQCKAQAYLYGIKEHRDALYCVMLKIQRDLSTGQDIVGGLRTQRKFRMILLGGAEDAVSSKGPSGVTTNDDKLYTFSAQLIELPLEKIATMKTGLVARFTPAVDVLRTLITTQAMDGVAEDDVKIKCLDIVDPDVTAPLEGVVIPHELKLVDLPAWLQAKEKGLYHHSVGCFIKHQSWFVYPLFNLKRYSKETERLTVYYVPTSLMPETPINWRYQDGALEIVCSDSIHLEDQASGKQLTEGTGARFMRPGNAFEDATVKEGNKHTYNREKVLAEINVIERQDGAAIANSKNYGVTDNVAKVLSDIHSRTGAYLKVVWRKPETSRLIPGMASMIYYAKGNTVVSHEGVLLHVEELWENRSGNFMTRTLESVAVLTFFVERGIELPKESE